MEEVMKNLPKQELTVHFSTGRVMKLYNPEDFDSFFVKDGFLTLVKKDGSFRFFNTRNIFEFSKRNLTEEKNEDC